MMRIVGHVAVSRVHLGYLEGDTLGTRNVYRRLLSLWEYDDVSACGLLGGRETKKLFGRRIWRATDECLAADGGDAAADGRDGRTEKTANDRSLGRSDGTPAGGREGGRGEGARARACSSSVRRTAGGNMRGHGCGVPAA